MGKKFKEKQNKQYNENKNFKESSVFMGEKEKNKKPQNPQNPIQLNFENFSTIYNIFDKISKESTKVKIPNKNLIFIKSIMACFGAGDSFCTYEDISRYNIEGYFKDIKNHPVYGKYNIDWSLPTLREIREVKGMLRRDSYRYYYINNFRLYRSYDESINDSGNWNYLLPIYRLIKNYELEKGKVFNYSGEGILKIFLREELIPEEIYNDEKLKEDFEKLMEDYKRLLDFKMNEKDGIITYYFSNGDREISKYVDNSREGKSIYYFSNGDTEERYYRNNKIEGLATYKFGNKEKAIFLYSDKGRENITKVYNLLNVDKIRVNLDPYDKKIMLDPNRGHWDLMENVDKSYIENTVGEKIYAKNPKNDIKQGGIIGIDFGTKSTVVVFQDDTKILPMRISGTELNKEIEDNHYENPTVIEFKDVENFMKDYSKKLGRPFTKWEDITVSHTAFESLMNGDSSQFNSIISDLKQWSASKSKKIVIRDKEGNEKVFKSYLNLSEEDIDPIEIYAYYIGSYINNMRNGIYLEYFLSFPVNYEIKIRNKILSSFEKGIKKSLPTSILKDKDVMKKFKVRHGANEPAAYSVCALQEYELEPETEKEEIYFGVFDFGGGTTDFDFGTWKYSEDERSFDYELKHFGANGNRYLGGENILRELAFEVFKENESILREKKITFARPEWCEKFLGDETLVDNSQEAELNIKILMEKLRSYWEVEKGNKEKKEERMKINLYKNNGEQIQGLDLDVESDQINKIIENKISQGIDEFFISMNDAFKNENCDKINVFLAGNSCKHPFVMKKFEEYKTEIEKKEEKIKIELYPALGTQACYEKMKSRNIEYNMNDKTKPTGKTGVAYGIVESRSGGRIKIINNNDKESNEKIEARFKYFIGYARRKKLEVVLNPNKGYYNNYYLVNTTSDVFDVYYTTSPEAIDGKLSIEKVKRRRVPLEKNYGEDAKVYIQAVGVDKVEYLVTKSKIEDKNPLEKGIIKFD